MTAGGKAWTGPGRGEETPARAEARARMQDSGVPRALLSEALELAASLPIEKREHAQRWLKHNSRRASEAQAFIDRMKAAGS